MTLRQEVTRIPPLPIQHLFKSLFPFFEIARGTNPTLSGFKGQMKGLGGSAMGSGAKNCKGEIHGGILA